MNSSTIVGNPELVNDRNGNSNGAYRFDGIDDYIDAGNPIETILKKSLSPFGLSQTQNKTLQVDSA